MAVFSEAVGYFGLQAPIAPVEATGGFALKEAGYFFEDWLAFSSGDATGGAADYASNALVFGAAGGDWTSPLLDTQGWAIGAWDGWEALTSSGAAASLEARSTDDPASPADWIPQAAGTLSVPIRRYLQFRVTVSAPGGALASLALFWVRQKLVAASASPAPIAVGGAHTIGQAPLLNETKTASPAPTAMAVETRHQTTGPVAIAEVAPIGGLLRHTMERRDDDGSSYSRVALPNGSRFRKTLNLPTRPQGQGMVMLEIGIDRPGKTSSDADPIVDVATIGPVWVSVNGVAFDARSALAGALMEDRLNRVALPSSAFALGDNLIEVWNEPSAGETLYAGLDAGDMAASGPFRRPGPDSAIAAPLMLTPILSGPDARVSASSQYSDWAPYRVFDGLKTDRNANCWASDGSGFPQWLRWDCGAPTRLTGYAVVTDGGLAPDQRPSAWQLQGSNDDGATWDVLDDQAGVTWQPLEEKAFAVDATYASYRLYLTQASGSNYLTIAEWKLSGAGMVATPIADGELRFWAYSPEPRVVESNLFLRQLDASVEIVRPAAGLEVSALIEQASSADLDASADVMVGRQVALDASAEITRDATDLPASAYATAPASLGADATVTRPDATLPASATVTAPVDLPGSFDLAFYLDLDAMGQIVRAYADLPCQVTIKTVLDLDVSATLVAPIHLAASATIVTPTIALDASFSISRDGGTLLPAYATTARPAKDLPGAFMVSGAFGRDLDASARVRRSSETALDLSVVLAEPAQYLPMSASVTRVPVLDASFSIARPAKDFPASAEVITAGIGALDAMTEIYRPYRALPMSALVAVPHATSLAARATVMDTSRATSLPAYASVIPLREKALFFRADVLPYRELGVTAEIYRPYDDLLASATIRTRAEGSVIADALYAATSENVSMSWQTIQPLDALTRDTMGIRLSDGDAADYDELPFKEGRTVERAELGLADAEIGFRTYADDNANWGMPVKLTNNLYPNEVVSNPFLGAIDDVLVVGFEAGNGDPDLTRLHVVRRDGPDAWTPIKQVEGTAGSIAGGALRFTGEEGVYEWVPPGPGDDAYEIEAPFDPIERRDRREMALAWDVLLYEMQKQGEIVYPPPAWPRNPMTDHLVLSIREVAPTEPGSLEPDFSYQPTFDDIIIQ